MIFEILIVLGGVLAMGAIGLISLMDKKYKELESNLARSEKILADLNCSSDVIAEYEKEKGIGRIIPDDIYEVLEVEDDQP